MMPPPDCVLGAHSSQDGVSDSHPSYNTPGRPLSIPQLLRTIPLTELSSSISSNMPAVTLPAIPHYVPAPETAEECAFSQY